MSKSFDSRSIPQNLSSGQVDTCFSAAVSWVTSMVNLLAALAVPDWRFEKNCEHLVTLRSPRGIGVAQQDSFEMKPDAPADIRGEFSPIATRTEGISICEHLPLLAGCSDKWALVRSLTHPYNEHSQGHHVMLTGRTPLPQGFDASKPKPTDFPTIASVVTGVVAPRNNLPPAAVLPEKLIHVTGRTIPGQFAGEMGVKYEPWFIEASQYRDTSYIHGAFPEYGFQRQKGRMNPPGYRFEAPRIELAEGVLRDQFHARVQLLESIQQHPRQLDQTAQVRELDRHQQTAISMLTEGHVHRALDVHAADSKKRRIATDATRSGGLC